LRAVGLEIDRERVPLLVLPVPIQRLRIEQVGGDARTLPRSAGMVGAVNQIAPDVHQIALTPRNAINAYLVGKVLVDTGIAPSAKKLAPIVREHGVEAIALTHAHGDHAGSAGKLSEEFGLPVWVGAADREAAETGTVVLKQAFQKPGLSVIAGAMANFKKVPVARALAEGDELAAGFTVLDVPGHSPGHVAYWRASDGVLIAGDVFFNMHLLTTVPGLRQPPGAFTPDPAQNRASERKLAALEPSVVGFGHGPVLSDDAAGQLRRFVDALPA
jgi:glyoxylase-like metal-dependent hydrolase (beta-lactamase superfamily II)